MRNGRVAFFSLIMVVVMTTTCFAFEIGSKAGLHEPQGDYSNLAKEGATFGFQMKNSLTDFFSWGVHVGYGKATKHTKMPGYYSKTGKQLIKSGITMIEHHLAILRRTAKGINYRLSGLSLRWGWGFGKESYVKFYAY